MLNLILVATGIVIFGYSLYLHVKFLGMVKKTPLEKWWVILSALVLFFTLGYIVFAYWLVTDTEIINISFLEALVSFIFFFEAIFVVVTISLISFTVRGLIKGKKETQQLQAELEQKVRERTLELQSKVKGLSEAQLTLQSLAGDTQKEKEIVEIKVEERTQELREEQARLKASINSLNIGFIMTNVNSQIITINEAAKHLFCYRYAGAITPQMLTQSCTIIDITAVLAGVYDLKGAIKQVLDQRIASFEEVQIQSRFVSINISPIIVFEKGIVQTLGVVVLVQDITERKLIERTKDEFFSIASHELRTPLTAIKGNTALIEQYYWDKLPSQDVKEMVSDIHESSTRLIAIVNDFLNVSRLELGRMEFKKEAFDVLELTNVVIKESETLAKQKGLSLQLINTQVFPPASGDRDRTKEALLNLVSNAVKYTEKGEIRISFQVKDRYFYILVTDSGRGIPIESQSLLFRKFQQASNNLLTRDTTKSTGLGLYISKMIMEGMGGKIGLLSSEKNKGSTFYIGLPIASQQQINAQQPTQVQSGVGVAPQNAI